MKKKILFMLKMVDCGGVEQALLNLLDVIDKDKFECELILMKKKGEYLDRFEKRVKVSEICTQEYIKDYLIDETMPKISDGSNIKEKISYCTLYAIHQLNRITKKFFKKNIVYKYAFSKCNIAKENIDVAIDYMGYGSFTTYYISKLNKDILKYSWIHEQRMTEAFEWNKNRYKKFEKIYAVCQDCADVFATKFPMYREKVGVMHNILDLENIHEKSMEELEVEYLSDFMILSVGRLAEQKTFDRAVEAANVLKNDGERFKWVIIGEGPERNRIQKLIDKYKLNDYVILHGYESNPFPYFRKADLYVQTSKAEGYCTTITEATVLGKAVVTTDVTGVYEQLANGKGGIIVHKDYNEVASAIKEFMHNEEKKRSCSEFNLNRNYDYAGENRAFFEKVYKSV